MRVLVDKELVVGVDVDGKMFFISINDMSRDGMMGRRHFE